jgi:hypothetical protein
VNGLEHMETRYAQLERAQARSYSRDRAIRMAHMLSAIRRFKEVTLRSASAATRHPFSNR